MKQRRIIGLLAAILWLGLFPAPGLNAQDQPPEKAAWNGDISLGLSLSRGNSDNTSMSFTANLNGRPRENLEWLNSALYIFGRAEQVTNAETYQLSTRLNWTLSTRFFSYIEVQGIRDRFKNYAYQILPGVGVGVKLVTLETMTFSLSGGLTEVLDKYYDSGDTDAHLSFALGDALVWKISETAEFNQKMEWNFDASRLDHFLARFEANLITALAKNWSVKLTVINRHDSSPVGEGIEKNDFSFLAAVSMKF